MDGSGLSDRERQELRAIETELAHDRTLAQLMRRPDTRRTVWALCVLGPVSLALFLAACLTVTEPVIWAFAGSWMLTVAAALPLVGHWWRRRWQRRARAAGAGTQ
ncbi:DUF3040 domain-containing protein [Streptomyces bambusae]|uniref:DUF3040 domain-containing protein n=1 Tax=Streptomyces bambusae TaxID=1550616 RepID=UPI001CFE8CFA|nr:DUF3040 domain-containing protein [Streptomyces bambusae]MCB5165363.1 DUF3040 domain-containing protein [Streptomyces bambusae]